MRRQKRAQKLGGQIRNFLKENPAIKEALRVFDISYDQYQRVLESGYSYYSGASTSTQRIKYRAK